MLKIALLKNYQAFKTKNIWWKIISSKVSYYYVNDSTPMKFQFCSCVKFYISSLQWNRYLESTIHIDVGVIFCTCYLWEKTKKWNCSHMLSFSLFLTLTLSIFLKIFSYVNFCFFCYIDICTCMYKTLFWKIFLLTYSSRIVGNVRQFWSLV